jgi:hypothetical protein
MHKKIIGLWCWLLSHCDITSRTKRLAYVVLASFTMPCANGGERHYYGWLCKYKCTSEFHTASPIHTLKISTDLLFVLACLVMILPTQQAFPTNAPIFCCSHTFLESPHTTTHHRHYMHGRNSFKVLQSLRARIKLSDAYQAKCK